MAVLKSKMAAAKNGRSGNEDFTWTKQLKTSKIVELDEIYHKMILVTLNQPYLIIEELDLKGRKWGGVSKTQCCRQTLVKMQIDVVCVFALRPHYKL